MGTPTRDLCRREGIKSSTYYACLKNFMEVDKERLGYISTNERNGLDNRHERAGETLLRDRDCMVTFYRFP